MLLKLVDFGLVILIWMTQLIVYPSFQYYSVEKLLEWHSKYTTQISIIVMPLMLAQVALHGYGLVNSFSYWRLFTVVAILLAWVNTFGFAVPLHNQIAAGVDTHEAVSKLINVNWYRTVLWSLVFLLGIIGIKSSSQFY